jgi:Raf kinase inhibitor-like YbhB/YbcL family protein
MNRSARLLAVTGAVAVALALATAAVMPAVAHIGKRPVIFGYTTVRQGIPRGVPRFELTSPDVRSGQPFPPSEFAAGFGCTGANQQPRLHWTGAPGGTASYAVTMFDKDAPTGSGFWHWLVWDIPASETSLTAQLPAGAVAGTNDAALTGYLGPCPAAGDRRHRYELTVLALDVPSLSLSPATPPALATFTMRSHIIGFARITVTAQRP